MTGQRVVLRFLFLAACLPLAAEVSFRAGDGRIEVLVDGKPFTNFYHGAERPIPFLHPLRAASGVTVTRGFPVERIEGESQDHPWHHGLWYAHGDINGVDFWRDRGPQLTGRIVGKQAPRFGGDSLRGEFELVAPGGKVLGSLRLEFRFAGAGDHRLVDVTVSIRADRNAPLKMGDTEEGSLGLRLADEFREDRGAALTNSDGLAGTRNIWGKRARWVDYSATRQGEPVGVTLYDHPANPKHPTFWHARGYGLCAANPFGEHDFLKDRARDGSLTIPAGGTLRFRYRVLIHKGPLDREAAERWAARFAQR